MVFKSLLIFAINIHVNGDISITIKRVMLLFLMNLRGLVKFNIDTGH